VGKGDHYLLAVPIESAQALMSEELAGLDPQCARLRAASIARLVSWMVGIQFYLRQDVPLARGHMVFPDAPWALTAISQPQFWMETIGRFRDHYGNGEVNGLISVDISQWEAAGQFVEKPAIECTKDEIKTEVWSQLKAALNGQRPDQQTLTDDLLYSWHLDDDLDYSVGVPPTNSSRLLVHPPGSWAIRPESASTVANLCFAGDYVRTYTDIASMEAACESGRRAANVILDRESSSAARVPIWTLEEPKEFDSWKQLDAQLFRSGRPHIFETGGIRNAFQAAELLRRFSAFAGLAQIEDFFRSIKFTDLFGGFFDRFGPGR
jgi:15-cis-phytoene desaturase